MVYIKKLICYTLIFSILGCTSIKMLPQTSYDESLKNIQLHSIRTFQEIFIDGTEGCSLKVIDQGVLVSIKNYEEQLIPYSLITDYKKRGENLDGFVTRSGNQFYASDSISFRMDREGIMILKTSDKLIPFDDIIAVKHKKFNFLKTTCCIGASGVLLLLIGLATFFEGFDVQ